METWIIPAALGVGLAAASGLKTFLPLLALSLAARFQLFGIELNDSFAWVASTPALVALAIATVLEIAADKVPVLDNALSAVGTVTRPAAGVVAAGSVFAGVDPTTAAVAGVILGAPTALAMHGAQSGARLTSTAATAGVVNPVLSVVEDVLSVALVLVAFVLPLLVPVLVVLLLYGFWRLAQRVRGRRHGSSEQVRG